MKNIKKLNRRDLEKVKGAATYNCDGCPTHLAFGPGSPSDPSCEAYWRLSENCRMCVMVSVDCFVAITPD
ncbi:bacteriocin-like protein [Chryseobacterium sp. Tr-659]|uniref:bacteriocin-like protein n=1 Tax=Chryseobacterium sp. Tr-659 TaxID=2608340 RepID=UPI003977AEF6